MLQLAKDIDPPSRGEEQLPFALAGIQDRIEPQVVAREKAATIGRNGLL